jgi:tRNA U34 2-thiouridine synthase MnmA/TrmU
MVKFHKISLDTKLLTSRDDFKDQTFFLSHIKQSSLKKTLFPIGGLLKSEVRKLASDNGLEHVSNRQDSTGICFIGRRNFQEFISEVCHQADA